MFANKEVKRNGSLKVGAIGTISTLMSKELETMKQMPQATSSSQRKHQSKPVSTPCGFLSKKKQSRKYSSKEAPITRNGSNNSNSSYPSTKDAEDVSFSRNSSRGKKVDKKGHSYTAEVADVKCNKNVSSRLKKLGFSKLSKSFA